MTPQQYCLRWKHHHSNVQSMFAQLLEKERFCDVTLYCSSSFAAQLPEPGALVDPGSVRGVSVRAHRVVLAACSELLASLLGAHEALGEPVLVIDGAAPAHVRALLDYMYTGEMSVHHEELPGLLKTAEELRIKGLTDIRWHNKDEPPDSKSGAVTTVAKKAEVQKHQSKPEEPICISPELEVREERHNVNGGPPPLIKLNSKGKISPPGGKRGGASDTASDTPSPKRQRAQSCAEHTDDEDREEWKHGNLDITAERVSQWGNEENASEGSWERDRQDEDEWGDAPTDIGRFLDTRLRVDGDNSLDDSSNDDPPPHPSMIDTSLIDLPMIKTDISVKPLTPTGKNKQHTSWADWRKAGLPEPTFEEGSVMPPSGTAGPKSGPADPRFTDVVRLNDYLRHGRRPQFWEEDYVKRVMEAVRLKELEMKQAAEILGVSYGTLYGRYRDVYGCINRPYRNARDFYAAKAPSEVLDRLQRGEIPADVAAQALGVSARDLLQHLADLQQQVPEPDFEPIPIEIDPLLKLKTAAFPPSISPRQSFKTKPPEGAGGGGGGGSKPQKRPGGGDEEIPATMVSAQERRAVATAANATVTNSSSGKWPSIRLTSLDALRAPCSSSSSCGGGGGASPTLLMRSRPDLTIVAARKPDPPNPENGS